MYCSANNGRTLSNQEIQLLLEGPEDKNWFASYSINEGPAITMNDGNAIELSEYKLSLYLENNSGSSQYYTIKFINAWIEDLTPIIIPEKFQSLTLQILALASPEISDYSSLVKTNSTQTYTAEIGKYSGYSLSIPENATLLETECKIVDNNQEIDFKIKWSEEEVISYFKLIETDPFGCNSDTIFAGVETVDSFQIYFEDSISICEGDSISLEPSIDLVSDYSYSWSTGENTKDITVDQAGIYELTVTDLNDNQTVTRNVEVQTKLSPIINIEDYLVVEDENPIIDAYEEGASYLWSDGSTDSELEISQSGNYSITVTSRNSCSSSKFFSAKLKSDLFEINLPEIIHMCGNEKLILKPSLSIDQNYKYEWNDSSTVSSIIVSEAGEYEVTVTDPDGFTQSANTNVFYHSNPIVDLGKDLTLWEGESTSLDAGNKDANFLWNTGETNQIIEVDSGGMYSVEVSDEFACSNKDSLFIEYKNGQKFEFFLGEDQSICSGDSIELQPLLEGNPLYPLRYNWLGLGKSSERIHVSEKGNYCLEITDSNGNTESDCVKITILPTPMVNLGQNLESFENKKIILNAGAPNCHYKWVTGDITQNITVKKEGEYWVKVSNNSNCSASDTITVSFRKNYPSFGLPNAFSPNGDGHNDKLFIRGENVKEATLIIYNRLGQKIFESSNINNGWDGSFKGKLQGMDVYVYLLEVTFLDGKKINKKGNVALLR
ncbi:gliding motility-associated C-terminal domain-containing protein [Labilibaculum sp.]|uniref:gliding motility-associated C-terminal domain-containing protein n=1 Tax=Labilibaculum sp. TaxID=2060723 RepID=UPI0035647BE3